LPPDELVKAAEVNLRLFAEPEHWIHRRVERIEFRDDTTARHRISLDFSLPPETPSVAQLHRVPVYLAPLFIVAKDHPNPARQAKDGSVLAAYWNLDYDDETGRSLPLSTRKQGSRIAGMMLVIRGEDVARRAGKDLSDALRDKLVYIATADSFANPSNLHAVMRADIDENDVCNDLRSDPLFRELAYAFATHWLVVHAFVCAEPPQRCIVKLAFDEFAHREQGSVEAELRKSLGWKSTIMWTQLPEIGAAGSYHLEISAPPDLEITELGIFGEPYHLGWGGLPPKKRKMMGWRGLWRRSRRRDTKLNLRRRPPRDIATCYIKHLGPLREGQIYLTENPPRRVGATWVKLRVRRQGIINGALFASAILFLTLVGFAHFADPIVVAIKNGGSSGPITALVLLPTVLAAYLARPGEHALTGRMLRALRVLLAIDGGLPFIAAMLLLKTRAAANGHAAQVGAHTLSRELYWLAAVSAGLLLAFLASNVWPRAHGGECYWRSNKPKDRIPETPSYWPPYDGLFSATSAD
jgi:hypothetical protein